MADGRFARVGRQGREVTRRLAVHRHPLDRQPVEIAGVSSKARRLGDAAPRAQKLGEQLGRTVKFVTLDWEKQIPALLREFGKGKPLPEAIPEVVGESYEAFAAPSACWSFTIFTAISMRSQSSRRRSRPESSPMRRSRWRRVFGCTKSASEVVALRHPG